MNTRKSLAYLIFWCCVALSSGYFAPQSLASEPTNSVQFEPSFEPSFELSEADYIERIFDGQSPPPQRMWIRGKLKEKVERILQHRVGFLRTKYWRNDNKSAWILNEIGKERPITIGVTLERARFENDAHKGSTHARISDVTILAFRESRGWEVKHDFFTRQFNGAALKNDPRAKDQSNHRRTSTGLDKSIDGISGATLSVRAVKKVAEIALLLDSTLDKQASLD